MGGKRSQAEEAYYVLLILIESIQLHEDGNIALCLIGEP